MKKDFRVAAMDADGLAGLEEEYDDEAVQEPTQREYTKEELAFLQRQAPPNPAGGRVDPYDTIREDRRHGFRNGTGSRG